MSMDIELKNLLQRTLVVPYDDEETARLERVCDAYVQDEDFSDDTVADLAIMVMSHTQDDRSKKKFAKIYEVQNGGSLALSKSVCEALGAYTVYKAASSGDITYNLALLNCMVLMNKRWEHTSFPELFAECIETALRIVDNESRLEMVDDTDYLTKLFGSKDELENTTMDNDSLKIVKQLARDAWYHRTHEYINSEELKGYNTYIKAFVALQYIVNSMPWNFLNERAVEQIKEIASNTKAKELTIEEIVGLVRPYYDIDSELNSHSSLLLQVIADKEHRATGWPFMKTSLSVREFAVYLYYELILEKYFR